MCAVYTYSVKYCSNIETSAPFQIVLDIDTIEMLSLQFGEKGGGYKCGKVEAERGEGRGDINQSNPLSSFSKLWMQGHHCILSLCKPCSLQIKS